jgi:RHS repeat-associated protein
MPEGPFVETPSGWSPLLAWDSDVVNYGYTGRQFDSESGQYYYRARMYNPATGRFTSKDPLGFKGGDINLYRYAENNSLRYKDPSGLAISNPTNVPGVPNSCGSTPIQIFFEPIEGSSVLVIFAGGNGTNPDIPGAYAGTYGNVNDNSSVYVDVDLLLNLNPVTMSNTLVHEGVHVLGGDEDVAYPIGDALYPPISLP